MTSASTDRGLARRWDADLAYAAGDAALYRLRLDPVAGLVRGEAHGSWNAAQTARYCANLESLVMASRRTIGRVRVLLDRRGVGEQSDDIRAMLASANAAIFGSDDKLAIIVTTSLMKSSLRERMPHAGTKAFLSISAAETWLSV